MRAASHLSGVGEQRRTAAAGIAAVVVKYLTRCKRYGMVSAAAGVDDLSFGGWERAEARRRKAWENGSAQLRSLDSRESLNAR
ncbi:hypothetical protein [Brevibacterium oceani]|uniref:hypothetical protein n=1 Tax=Brevibacterium oceani TaxID=358099 RepID=UPI0015E69D06|nr:hypothetical protein [Brevibacterium oceani]